jgi:hypothetical protein
VAPLPGEEVLVSGVVAVGVVFGSVGYLFGYYAVQLWKGEAVSLASASGFAAPPAAQTGGGSGTSGIGRIVQDTPLLFFL